MVNLAGLIAEGDWEVTTGISQLLTQTPEIVPALRPDLPSLSQDKALSDSQECHAASLPPPCPEARPFLSPFEISPRSQLFGKTQLTQQEATRGAWLCLPGCSENEPDLEPLGICSRHLLHVL